MTISVPPELERFVAEQVASGRYTSASEVVGEALRLLEEQNSSADEQDLEPWLRESVVPVYDRMQASPERAIPAEEVFHAIRRRHAEQRKRSS
jgi:antitoxin ParD1/3/4